jgi:hypothetical protein
MQKLCEDKDFHDNLAHKAKTYIEDKLGSERATNLIKQRIEEIYLSVNNVY